MLDLVVGLLVVLIMGSVKDLDLLNFLFSLSTNDSASLDLSCRDNGSFDCLVNYLISRVESNVVFVTASLTLIVLYVFS